MKNIFGKSAAFAAAGFMILGAAASAFRVKAITDPLEMDEPSFYYKPDVESKLTDVRDDGLFAWDSNRKPSRKVNGQSRQEWMEALCSEPNEHVNKYRVQEGKYYVHQTFVEVRWLVLEPRYRIIKIERVFEADAACGTTRMAEYSIPGSLETGSIYLDTALLYEIHY